VRLEGLSNLKISNNLIANRTRDLPSCSVVFFFFYSSCSHLEPRLSAKCLFHFSFLIYTPSVGHFGRGISPSQGHYLHTEQHKHRINHTDIHASSGIRTHNISFRSGEDSSLVPQPDTACLLYSFLVRLLTLSISRRY
jgi:hypothetical protein